MKRKKRKHTIRVTFDHTVFRTVATIKCTCGAFKQVEVPYEMVR